MRRFLSIELVYFLFLWLALMVGGRSSFLRDPGTFWHVTTGRIILDEGFIKKDPYTYTFPEGYWIPYQWLAEVCMAPLDRLGGFDALLMTAVTIVAALFAWLGGRLVRMGLHPVVTGLLLSFAVLASATHFHVRPHLLTMVGTAGLFAWLCAVDARRLPVRSLWWTFPIFVLWTNWHGGVLGGLATMALVFAGWMVGDREMRKQWMALAGVFALGLLSMICTPYGWELAGIWKKIMASPVLPTIIKEHMPPQWDEAAPWTIVGFGIIYIGLLTGVPVRNMRLIWLLPLVWFYMGMSRVRHAPLFAVVGLVAVAEFFPATRWAKRLLDKGSDWFTPPTVPARPSFGWLFPVGLVWGTCLVLQSKRVEIPVMGAGWAQLDSTVWPTDIHMDLYRIHESVPERTPIFNEYIQGGYLIYFFPKFRVFVDDRCEVFGDDFLRQYVDAEGNDPAGHVRKWAKDYGTFPYALTQRDSGYDQAFAGDKAAWEMIAEGRSARLYKRK